MGSEPGTVLTAGGRRNRAARALFDGLPDRYDRLAEWLSFFQNRRWRAALADAVAAGQLGPGADSDEAVWLVSTLITGVLSQAIANEPGLAWGQGRFTPLFPKLMKLLAAAYPAASARRSPQRAPEQAGQHAYPGRAPKQT